MVENSPDLIARFDRQLRRCYVNPAIERLTGHPASELLGKTLSELNFRPEFRSPIEEALTEVFATGNERTLEVLLPGPEGEHVFQSRVVPEQGADGRAEFALVISRDITTIRRGEERLRALTNDIELLLASTYEGICAVDLSGRCTLVNASAGSMLGHMPKEMLGKVLHDLIHPQQDGSPGGKDDCGLLRVAADGTPVHVTHEVFHRRDGSSFPVEIFISPIVDGDGQVKGMVASFIDVSQREQLRTELDRANRMAGLGRIATAMSHEFNNVLMGIQPFAEVLLRASAEPRVIDSAKRIIQSVERGRSITGDLRAFANSAAPVRKTVDVRSWLSSRTDELRTVLPPSVQLDVVTHGVMKMAVDADQIMQVLRNLVQNAREALGNGAGTVRLETRLVRDRNRFQTDEPFVDLSLSDDGPGIGAASTARIIEPFFTTKEGGKGLGLAIAQQIVSLHGGRLFIESDHGAGTTVHVYLPAATDGHAVDQIPTPARARRLPSDILFVEDDEAVASGVTLLLEDEQVQVRLATTAAAALEMIESWKPQALLIDINLPDGNGFDLYEQISASIGSLPVVFASGHADPSRLAAVKASAPVRLLTKPYAIDTLLETLEQVVQPR